MRDRALEIATYVGVFLAIWVVSPLAGKFIDALFLDSLKIFADSPFILGIGILLILIGSTIVGWTIYLFKVKGRGTPNPKLPPKTLIVIGPYKYSRNPMALGGFLTLVGQALVYYSPSLLGIAVLFGIIVYFNAMFVEEPELRKRFGEPYEAYLKQVPRFFPNPTQVYRQKGGDVQ
jgi:protein-S-isoprenylcysteine O-methyltransferase Ste14